MVKNDKNKNKNLNDFFMYYFVKREIIFIVFIVFLFV